MSETLFLAVRASNSEVNRIWPDFELVLESIPVLNICKFEEDPEQRTMYLQRNLRQHTCDMPTTYEKFRTVVMVLWRWGKVTAIEFGFLLISI